MIINKKTDKISGHVEYRYSYQIPAWKKDFEEYEYDEDSLFEVETFSNLEEFLVLMNENKLKEIKRKVAADKVWISDITFRANSEDGQNTSNISLLEDKKTKGFISTKIDNEDIENRMFSNMEKIKEIVDNTLKGFPTKY